ncbi:MAG: hypothetical protein P1P89_21935 [Desulfobacterales bacterium]|nr:hypothetical protein [Desulfobacterales bacterium]
MKTGVIIYAAGSAPDKWTEEDEQKIRKSVFGADAVEIITSKTGHFDIFDAWWSLLTKGMPHIVCKMAVFADSGEFKLTGRELRLCG